MRQLQLFFEKPVKNPFRSLLILERKEDMLMIGFLAA
jgi:hypothetical protein